MSTRESTPEGAPCWIELSTHNIAQATAFYGALFGWTFEDGGPEFGGYVSCFNNGQLVAGMMANPEDSGYPDAWTVYLKVSDATATQARVEANGGMTFVEPMAVANLGSMAVFTDPGHAVLGAWQPAGLAGYAIENEHGAPAWLELHTREYTASVEFYQQAFGWQVQVQSDTPEFRYTVQVVDDAPRAGVFDVSGFTPEGTQAMWLIYFGSNDVDATLARVSELGGTVVGQPEDSPFGRMATFADPTGATVKLVSIPN